ncbi:PIG-L family deacetylase [Ascidiimonas aurantiaca]|uniref:PIG-L family deacetylase n=1 Tax=Ascidiimonas aurantiaca TaxID=1685432 RepID=UPI0030EE1AA1
MRKFTVLLVMLLTTALYSQAPAHWPSSRIYESIQKLNFLGTALYIAAHPDDENTRLISYLSNKVHARTAYLSLTRGDGGQNLIGPELRELLGVIRTQELLAARRIDGGEQFFTRANDFGFSKHPDETLTIWDKEEVLANVVSIIRRFRPDVIINRFDHRSPGATHGHHTSSAMLSVEAFDLASDPNAYSSQLSTLKTWQPRRLFFNTSWWFYGSPEDFEKADKSKMVSVDAGVYYDQKGKSNGEIAALSRSQHSSQGFGSSGSRGSDIEYLEFLKGDFPKNVNNLFDGINTTWTRIEGGDSIGKILEEVESNFNFKDPSVHIPQLVKAYQLIRELKDTYWREQKTKEIKAIITACSGLFLEAVASESGAVPGSTFEINLEAINRSKASITMVRTEIIPGAKSQVINETLDFNTRNQKKLQISLPETLTYTTPYWLLEESTLGMYKVGEKHLIGKPETPRAVSVIIYTLINGIEIPFTRDVVYKFTDPKKGEVYQPFEILPPVTVGIPDKVTIFARERTRDISVKIRAGKANAKGTVSLEVPPGWRVNPSQLTFEIDRKGDEKTVLFSVTPSTDESEGWLLPRIKMDETVYSHELVEINYEHIPKQSVLLPSKARVVRLNIQKAGDNIGYIAGAGDKVPESLLQIGYNVRTITPENISTETLRSFDAIVVGIRAYNVVENLKFKQDYLLEYVKNGGNLIVQYNTSGRRRLLLNNLAPYPLEVSRDRVTDENAKVRMLAKDHAVLNFPNKINENDFDGWVQERGLYFPDKWDKAFTPVLSMNDAGESPKNGSLLVAPYGKGYYIYTGLSFFRELPAGVPGAFKLFANMLSLGKEQVEKKEPIKG